MRVARRPRAAFPVETEPVGGAGAVHSVEDVEGVGAEFEEEGVLFVVRWQWVSENRGERKR